MSEQVNTNPQTTEPVVTITDAAAEEITRLASQEKEDKLYLRLGVAAGGCSGMSYSMAFDTEKLEDDKELKLNNIDVVISEKAVPYLQGTILDYKGGMLGGGFAFENPNAKRSCGCGTSFSC